MMNAAPLRRIASTCAVALVLLTGAEPVPAQTNDSDTILNTYVLPRSGPYSPDRIAVPNARAIAAWIRSGHADASDEAFTHWDEEGAIPPACATCHSGEGFRNFHGLDGSGPGIEAPVRTGGVVDCGTCHDPNLDTITQISLPSGVSHPVTTGDATCTTCHQGRAAGVSVSRAVADLPDDTPNPELRFVNPHYAIAAATALGAYGGVGFHYPGQSYSGRFLHAKPVSTCLSCHAPHSLEVAADTCLLCHESGEAAEIRVSRQSYDGSGDLEKGIKADIAANSALLMSRIEDYAAQVTETPILYDGARFPYFFADANGDGVVDEADGRPVTYAAWSPRLLKAAYNWKVVNADPGIHVHNPHYALELLHDSIMDLTGALGDARPDIRR